MSRKVYGQKTTGQKTTGQKTTRTKGHHRRNFVVYFDEVYNELCASKKMEKSSNNISISTNRHVCCWVAYRSDNSSRLNCRVIKIQHQTQRLCLNRNLIGQATALITTKHHNLLRCSSVSLSINQTRYFGTLCRVVLTEGEHQTEQVSWVDISYRPSRHT